MKGKVRGQRDVIKMTHFANKKAMLMNCYIKGEKRKSKMGKEASLGTKGDSRSFRLYVMREEGDSGEHHWFNEKKKKKESEFV